MRGAARRDPDCDIASPTECLDLAREDLVEAGVVADGGEDGCVGRQRHRRECRAVPLEATHELGGDVLRVRGAAAVSEQEDLAARAETPADLDGRPLQGLAAFLRQTAAQIFRRAEGRREPAGDLRHE